MISYELAKQLDDLGIRARSGGSQGSPYWHGSVCFSCTNRPCGSFGYSPMPDCDDYKGEYNNAYLHPLDQLIKEVENRGYIWNLYINDDNQEHPYTCSTYPKGSKAFNLAFYDADTTEDATALALIEIVKKEKT